MKISSLGLLLLLSVSASAEQSSFRERFLRLGGSLQRFLNLDAIPETCEAVIVDFDTAADGTVLVPPLCVDKQWEELGLTFFAEGGEGKLPCLFDTANPGSEEAGGDADLGAPNEACTPSGPGIGEGGAPGTEGENCEPLGNVVIIQEKDVDVPDDNKNGGLLTLDFPIPGGQYVYEIGLLDIDYATSVVVVYENESGDIENDELKVPLLDDNSKQTLQINQARVRWIKVMFSRSGAVTYIKFCPLENPPPTPPAATPTIGGGPPSGGNEPTPEGGEPTPSGGGEPAPTPEGSGPEPTPSEGSAPTPNVNECVESGGTIVTGMCCLSVEDFPNTCLIGACGCSPDNSHEVKLCECPEGFCFDGTKCSSTSEPTEPSEGGQPTEPAQTSSEGAEPTPSGGGEPAPTPEGSGPEPTPSEGSAPTPNVNECEESGGTIVTGMCCLSVEDFPNTCLIGACGCSPDNSHEVKLCECPEAFCFDGTKCSSTSEPTEPSEGGQSKEPTQTPSEGAEPKPTSGGGEPEPTSGGGEPVPTTGGGEPTSGGGEPVPTSGGGEPGHFGWRRAGAHFGWRRAGAHVRWRRARAHFRWWSAHFRWRRARAHIGWRRAGAHFRWRRAHLRWRRAHFWWRRALAHFWWWRAHFRRRRAHFRWWRARAHFVDCD